MKQSIFMLTFLLMLIINAWGQSVGSEAPDFTLTSTDNETITLSDYKGKVVYLFFFGYN